VPGLPELLPAGETVLWRGSPTFWGLASTVFHVRAVTLYFLALIVWAVLASLQDGRTLGESVALALKALPYLAAFALALLGFLAWLIQRTTIYTITTRRVVIRYGMAMPFAINLPFARIEGAAVNLRSDGTGDVALSMSREDPVSYVFLWPHVRPWRITRPEPLLRSVPEAEKVARILSDALAASSAVPAQVVRTGTERTQAPASGSTGVAVDGGRTAAA
jgi:hypothetical protein